MFVALANWSGFEDKLSLWARATIWGRGWAELSCSFGGPNFCHS